MEKEEYFLKEITYIKNSKYKENIKVLIRHLPDYFFHMPASSTGKYHPAYALGDGGLVRHTKVVVRIGKELLENNSIGNIFKPEEKDILLMAMILHDSVKSGIPQEQYCRFDHPLLASKLVRDHREELTLSDEEIDLLCNAIEAHMGEWNKDYNGNEILPKPSNRYQKFVHMCDFLASKKFLKVEFDAMNDIKD